MPRYRQVMVASGRMNIQSQRGCSNARSWRVVDLGIGALVLWLALTARSANPSATARSSKINGRRMVKALAGILRQLNAWEYPSEDPLLVPPQHGRGLAGQRPVD